MADPFLPNSQSTVKPIRDVFVNKEHLNAISFNFTAAGSQICDMGAFQHNQQLQVNSSYGNLTVTISQDGENFYAGPTLSANGITAMNPAVRYIKLTASGACQGLVVGTLY
jgi:hypothetical protein